MANRRHIQRKRPSLQWRKIRAGWRDTLLLLREFGRPLMLFFLAMIGGGLLYFVLAEFTGQPLGSRTEAIYLVLLLTFLQPLGDFPNTWYLQPFYFLMPVVGIGILAQGVAEFGVLFFNRRARGKEWEMAVASTFSNHIVVIGLGHLGFRVIKELYDLDQDVVAVERDPDATLIAAVQEMGIPVVQADGRRDEALEAVGVRRAKTILLCTQNDSLNLQIALKARRMNPAIRVVIRIFDDEFADSIQEQFGFQAMSATGMAAPKFATAASGVDITRPITIEGQSLSLAKLDIVPNSKLIGRSVEEIENAYDVSIVLVRQDGESDFHPPGSRKLNVNNVIAVMAGVESITQIIHDNQ